MSTNPQPNKQPKKPMTLGDIVFAGLLSSIPVGIITIPVSAGLENWWWAVLTPPSMILIVALITGVNQLIGGNKAVLRFLAGIGLVLGTAAGAFIIWVGFQLNLDPDVCDPTVSDCVLVIDGEVAGPITESVGNQLFSNFLLSLAVMLPGAMIMIACVRTMVKHLTQEDPETESE